MKVHLYTDASVRPFIGAGLAAVFHFPSHKETHKWNVEIKHCSDANMAEFYALEQAILLLIDRDLCLREITFLHIHTDSEVLIDTIQKTRVACKCKKISERIILLLDNYCPWDIQLVKGTNPAHFPSREANGLGRSYIHSRSKRNKKLQEKQNDSGIPCNEVSRSS